MNIPNAEKAFFDLASALLLIMTLLYFLYLSKQFILWKQGKIKHMPAISYILLLVMILVTASIFIYPPQKLHKKYTVKGFNMFILEDFNVTRENDKTLFNTRFLNTMHDIRISNVTVTEYFDPRVSCGNVLLNGYQPKYVKGIGYNESFTIELTCTGGQWVYDRPKTGEREEFVDYLMIIEYTTVKNRSKESPIKKDTGHILIPLLNEEVEFL